MDQIELVSYAKINLTLEVLGKRPDGYHDIDSVVQIIDITDDLVITRADEGVITVASDVAGVPSGRRNLVFRACEEFFKETGTRGGAACFLRKRIPVQAGMGGGSGNAAATVVGLNRLYGCGLDVDKMAQIAASVGSDASLFVYGGTVRMRGRGDIIAPLPDAPELHLAVVKPGVGVSTAWAYSEMDRDVNRTGTHASDVMERAIVAGDRVGVVDGLYNDFDPVVSAVVGEVARAKSMLWKLGAENVLLSGSGSAVFGVFATQASAQQAVLGLCGEFSQVFLTRTVTRAESGMLRE
ncbi:4-(cytidine 5'-diphospho)-2-C-methyl-D-erythritol kinase [bacterium]|nr:4-(cytidine 5'-diphospho)-2-C-methyl-D-erythritol kinase [bacterium]